MMDGNLLTVPEQYRLAKIRLALLWTCYMQAQCPRKHSFRSQYPVYKLILHLGIFSLQFWLLALDSLPSTDRLADRASKPDDGAVSPVFLQLCRGQLGWTLGANQMCLQSCGAHDYKDESILGELPLISGDEVSGPETTIYLDIWNPNGPFRSWLGGDSHNSL